MRKVNMHTESKFDFFYSGWFPDFCSKQGDAPSMVVVVVAVALFPKEASATRGPVPIPLFLIDLIAYSPCGPFIPEGGWAV